MASERKLAANRRNAQQSTGPPNTTRTRRNAFRHGILSSEAFIRAGEGREDAKLLDELGKSLEEDLSPTGRLEELLVDKLVMLEWRWRRVIRFENAAIRVSSDAATDDLERRARIMQPIELGDNPNDNWVRTDDLEAITDGLKQDLDALDSGDPLEALPDLWDQVVSVAEKVFNVSLKEALGFEHDWELLEDFSKEDIVRVMAAASKLEHPSEDLRKAVRATVQREYDHVNARRERHRLKLERNRMLSSLPNDKNLEKVGRYEAHLSRQFYKALHELQRLQTSRRTNSGTTPLALDIALESN